tara:strand:- start:272 stop:538 length:267 start_codon:yes stop_codon:yes gene_type:complete
MYRGIKTELLDKATTIMEDYIPLVWNSSNYRLNILDVICGNADWTKRMIDFVEMHYINDTEDVSTIAQTIMHDIGGLMKNDEHFLPRI